MPQELTTILMNIDSHSPIVLACGLLDLSKYKTFNPYLLLAGRTKCLALSSSLRVPSLHLFPIYLTIYDCMTFSNLESLSLSGWYAPARINVFP